MIPNETLPPFKAERLYEAELRKQPGDHMSRRQVAYRLCSPVCLYLLLILLPPPLFSQSPLVTVPVKTLSVPKPKPEPMMTMPRPNPPQPTMPSGKFPQYDFGPASHERSEDFNPKNSKLRLLLLLTARPLVLELDITIDGKPFRQARVDRSERLAAGIGDSLDKSKTETGPPSESSDADQRLKRFIASTALEPTANNVGKYLSRWVDGPLILFLNDNFQRYRADQNPIFQILDRNHDATIDTAEIQSAVASLQACDQNHDSVIESVEIDQFAKRARAASSPANASSAGKLLLRLPEAEQLAAFWQELSFRYASRPSTLDSIDLDANRSIDPSELQSLQARKPDIRLAVDFNIASPASPKLALLSSGLPNGSPESIGKFGDHAIHLQTESGPLHFTALQAAAADQISIGAVSDGYPLMAELDPNDDGRFTMRELRSIADRLKSFDRNRDGNLTLDEAQAPLRFCIGLGPIIHGELQVIRRSSTAVAPTTAPPDWFVQMDRNQDNDLTREEFPGTDEQFKTLDKDSDQLISPDEAAK